MLRRQRYFSIGSDKRQDTRNRDKAQRENAEDIWTKCPKCNELLYTRELENNLKVCQKCGYHFRLSSSERIEYLSDEGSFHEEGQGIEPVNSIDFVSLGQRYTDKLQDTTRKAGISEAVVYGSATIEEMPVMLMVCDFRFFGGSMGSVYGEKLVRPLRRLSKPGSGL